MSQSIRKKRILTPTSTSLDVGPARWPAWSRDGSYAILVRKEKKTSSSVVMHIPIMNCGRFSKGMSIQARIWSSLSCRETLSCKGASGVNLYGVTAKLTLHGMK